MSDTDIPSPCIRHCCLDENDICLGCFRSLEEILIWQQSTTEQKRQTLMRCEQRKQQKLTPR